MSLEQLRYFMLGALVVAILIEVIVYRNYE